MREHLKQRRAELEVRLEQARQTEVDAQRIEQFCELIKQNKRDFSFENRRLALQAFRTKVWIDGNSINIEGVVPMKNDDIVSTTS